MCVSPRLSVKVAVKGTEVLTGKIDPLGGPVIVTTGLGLVTIMICWQVAGLPEESVAVQVMMVVPTG